MFLKALTLKGFKSFADTTNMELEPGVTVVVGPNGSGKSNVVDAIGWVLGAQAPSVVRSQKMDDVIFAGTSKRAALGRAEVSLTLDNSSGLLPIEFSEVTVTRTLWRSGDSEYAINNVPCRLLDIQELFSDTGVGRQQHVIVGQGQIDAVLNARPEDRRMVIEEAAGVLKHRKRKERAERRLGATEGNLQRLQDLQREVRRQLRPLQRQAEAARRHGALVTELRALQVFIVGRELATLRRRLADAGAAKAELGNEEQMCQSALAELDAAVLASEAELNASGGDDLGEELGRVEALRGKANGLLAVLDERRRGLDRERAALVDRAAGSTLESDVAKLETELAEQDARSAEVEPLLEVLAEEEAALAADRATFEETYAGAGAKGSELGSKTPAVTSKAAEVRGELMALHQSSERSATEVVRARERAEQLAERRERLAEEISQLENDLQAAEATEAELLTGAEAAHLALGAAEGAAKEAEERYQTAQDRRHSLDGRVEALSLALDDARSRAGAEELADLDGVIGTLLDLVDIDPGWEPAVEAACGEALAAVVVDSVETGRKAVEVLAQGEVSAAVLALGATRPAVETPSVGDPVRNHVRTERPEVAALLDTLLGSAVMLEGEDGFGQALDAALAHPGAVVVTSAGGRFAPSGWRAVTATTGATGAALATAEAEAAEAAKAAAVALEIHREAQAAHTAAREADDVARRTVEEHQRTRAALGDRRTRAGKDRDEAAAEAASLEDQLAAAEERREREQARIFELEELLPSLEAEQAAIEAEQAAARERTREMAKARNELDQRAASLSGRRRELEMQVASIADRRDFLTQRLEEARQRIAAMSEAARAADVRRGELDHAGEVLERLRGLVRDRSTVVESAFTELQERRRQQNEEQRKVMARLDDLRRRRVEAEKQLAELRERAQKAEIDEAEVRLRLEQTTETCRSQLDVEPHTAINAEQPELDDGMTPAARVRELERELKVIGPINSLALEEFEALQERHDFLQSQLDDVRSSRRELTKVIRAVDDEIVRVFAAAYADVSENFTQLFSTLFPGGEGRLRLTNPDELLVSGIEIEAKPSGKNVRKLSLLSGGERALTALAFLFAVFRSRPSPFYVMDEVEAALDDVNLHRFLDLVGEFRKEAQLLIVSHQKRTMEAAECLYGVSMQPGGSSKLVSEKASTA